MRLRTSLPLAFAVSATILVIVGCGPKDDPNAPFVPTKSSSKPKSPYTHEYYLSVQKLSAKELKEKVKVGMKSMELQDVLGNASGHEGTAKRGSMSFWRKDGTLKVNIVDDKVSGAEITKS